MQRLLMVMAASILFLGACSDDMAEEEMPVKAKAAAALDSAPAKPMARKLPAGAIDHTRDEQEFELRRSLYGVERMISTYEAAGHDTAGLKARKAELEQQLGRLTG